MQNLNLNIIDENLSTLKLQIAISRLTDCPCFDSPGQQKQLIFDGALTFGVPLHICQRLTHSYLHAVNMLNEMCSGE